MKVLFIAHLRNTSASGRQRLWALKECGLDVVEVDIDAYKKSRIFYKIIVVLKSSFLLKNTTLQKVITENVKNHSPDILWFEWPKEYGVSFFKKLKRIVPESIYISFQDDNPWGKRNYDYWSWTNYFKVLPFFDVNLVKRYSDIKNIKQLGGKETYMWEHGMYSPLFNILKVPTSKKYSVSFIGTCMDEREALIGYLLDNGLEVHVFGNQWYKKSNLPSKYPNNFHSAVEGIAYSDVIKNSLICLGLVSDSNQDEWTMRSFEVPACGTLLVAQRTYTHEKLFGEFGVETLFSSREECLLLLKKFSENKDYAKKIANQIHKRYIENEWNLESQMKKFIDSLKLS